MESALTGRNHSNSGLSHRRELVECIVSEAERKKDRQSDGLRGGFFRVDINEIVGPRLLSIRRRKFRKRCDSRLGSSSHPLGSSDHESDEIFDQEGVRP